MIAGAHHRLDLAQARGRVADRRRPDQPAQQHGGEHEDAKRAAPERRLMGHGLPVMRAGIVEHVGANKALLFLKKEAKNFWD
jgi:hypothetical protein